jgi:3-deoxy-manno-octulosonate cytidylyltransferase (CMP-KDO synthetase)
LRHVAVIPARFQSSRFPGKPLADIAGKPMIEHVYRRAAATPGIDAVVVATDDERIASAVESFGGVVRMTRATHRTGTDRVAEVARDLDCEIVVNVQGDLPMIEPDMIAQVIRPFRDDGVQMSTLRQRITDPSDYSNPNVVKVVADRAGDALYFSRSPVPFLRTREPAGLTQPVYKHIGLYAYRRAFLFTLAGLAQTALEVQESLEQLRVLEHGFRIRTVETQYESIEVDTPEDVERVRRLVTATHASPLPSR